MEIAYGDVIEGVDFDYVAKLTALNAVSLAGMASAPPPPADVGIKGAVSADTTLNWTRPGKAQAPDLAGYRIYWRLTTDPQWTHSVYVGDVTHAYLEERGDRQLFLRRRGSVEGRRGKPGGVPGRGRQLRWLCAAGKMMR